MKKNTISFLHAACVQDMLCRNDSPVWSNLRMAQATLEELSAAIARAGDASKAVVSNMQPSRGGEALILLQEIYAACKDRQPHKGRVLPEGTMGQDRQTHGEDMNTKPVAPAMSAEEFNSLYGFVQELTDTSFLKNRADGKEVVLSEADRESIWMIFNELDKERQARQEAYELAGTRASEILKLRARVKQLEDAVRKAIDHDASGHAEWDGEGNSYISFLGHRLLKDTLEAKPTREVVGVTIGNPAAITKVRIGK